jgi:threonine synthase
MWAGRRCSRRGALGGLLTIPLYGFMEMAEMGLIERVPKIAIIQAEGCAPMVHAWRDGKPKANAVIPDTRIAILSTGAPGNIYTYLYTLLCRSGGTMESVTDPEAFTLMLKIAKSEGTAMEPASAVAFAGAEKLVHQGTISKDELVVINCTGHTFPVEKHVLGDPWRVDINLSENLSPVPKEGLVSALENLDEKT